MLILLDYARRGRNAWWRYLAALIASPVIAIALGVVIVLALTLLHLAPPDLGAELTQPDRPVVFFIGTAVIFLTLLAGFAAAAWFVQKKSPADIIGLWRWRAFGWGAGLWFVAQVLALAADLALAPGAFKITAATATAMLALVAVPSLAVQTFAEEFVFRGYFTQGLLLALRRPWPAAVASGAVFGAAHIANGAPQAVNAVMFGVAAAYIAIRTGGLAFTYGMHLVNNMIGAVVVVSAEDVFSGAPALFTEHAPQLIWWDVAVQALPLIAAVILVRHLYRPDGAMAEPESLEQLQT